MSTQFTIQPGKPAAGNSRQRSSFPFRRLLTVAAVTGVGIAMAPMLLPGLVSSLSATSEHAYWYISRASAFVAFGLLWLSMLAGLGITSKLSSVWPGMPGSYELHRFTGLLGIGFGLIHALVLLGDRYINYNLAQLLVPFMGSNYKPEWVGFGQLAFYLLVVVAFSFYVRDRLGVHAWRLIHMLSFALFLMVLIHGLQSGTDSGSIWALALYWGSATSVLFCSIYRVVTVRRGRPKEARATSGLLAVAGRAQTRPPQAALVSPGRSSAATMTGVITRGTQSEPG
jgi:predicted ferric reductase